MNKLTVVNKKTILLSLAGFAFNIILIKIVEALSLPIFLDSVGTILTAILCGIIPGMLVGLCTNLVNSIADPISLYYAIISVLLAVTAAIGARHGAFGSWFKGFLLAIIFALIGGGLGSVLTWLLYGFSVGTGISAPLTSFLLEKAYFSPFYAQLSADLIIDIADKLITVALIMLFLKFVSDNFLKHCPRGFRFIKNQDDEVKQEAKDHWFYEKDGKRYPSLRTKVAMLIIITSLCLSTLSVTIGTLLYRNVMNDHYTEIANSAAGLVTEVLDEEELRSYISSNTEDRQYHTIKGQLNTIRHHMPDIQYIYVYDIQEDGCHVLFDLDTPELPGAKLGDVVDFDQSFERYLPSLLEGRSIPPVIADGQYGKLLTVYQPIYDGQKNCIAYAAVDISVSALNSESAIFAIRLICLLFAASVLIMSFAMNYIHQRVVEPLDNLAEVTGRFAYDNESHRNENLKLIQDLSISTHDEIENLYGAVAKTTDDVCSYILQLKAQSDEILAQATTITELQDRIIIAFAAMVENRDENTGGHIYRTARYVGIIAEAMGKNPKYSSTFTEEFIHNLEKSAPLHDIGKIKIPDTILNKPGRLTSEEFEVIKTHTTEGKKILDEVFHDISEENCFSLALDMAYCHHEKWNGEGYPQGISKTEIPLCARIMAVADVFDALTSNRSYKPAFSVDKACDIIRSESGKHFDPDTVLAFFYAIDEISAVAKKYNDNKKDPPNKAEAPK